MKFLQYLGRSFADTLLLLLGVTGVTFSLMSAYTVPADETQCFLYCLLFSALFSFLFHIRAHGRPVCIAVLLRGNAHYAAYIVFSILQALLSLFCHRKNIQRLLHHEENKLDFKKISRLSKKK